MYRKLPCQYLEDDELIIKDGTLVIENSFSSVKESGYFTATIYSGIYEFFESIVGDASLKDYDWSSYDTTLTIANILALNEDDEEITYPLIDWGAYKKGENIDIRYQFPCLKISAVVNKIIEKAGFTIEGALLSETRYTKASITLDTTKDIEDEVKLKNSAKLIGQQNYRIFYQNPAGYYDVVLRRWVYPNVEGYQFEAGDIHREAGGPRGGGGILVGTNRAAIWFDLLTQFRYGVDASGNSQDGSFIGESFIITDATIGLNNFGRPRRVYKATVEHTVRITSNFEYNARDEYSEDPELPNLSEISNEYGIIKNGIRQNSIDLAYNPAGGGDNGTVNIDYTISLKPGDELTIIFSTNIRADIYNRTTGGGYGYIDFESVAASTIGANISVNTLIPDIKAKDIIISIANMFGVIYTVSDKVLTATMFNEIADKGIDANNDWSDKLDISRGYSINPRIGEYSQINWAKYDDDNTDGIGNGQLQIDDSVLPINGELFTLVFAGSKTYYQIVDSVDSPPNGNTGITIPTLTLFEADIYNPNKEYASGELVQFGSQVWQAQNTTTGDDPGTTSDWALYQFQYEQTQTAKTRIVLTRRISAYDTNTLTYTDGITTSTKEKNLSLMAYFVDGQQNQTYGSPAYSGYGDLDMNTLLNDYYDDIKKMLFRCKEVTCYMRLKKKDIRKIDFLTPKHVQFFGYNFYLNKIVQYTGEASTQVVLIRM
jgi:hypothetical protein